MTLLYCLWLLILTRAVEANIELTSNDLKTSEQDVWKNPVGRLCMTVEHFRVVPDDNSSYFECATLTQGEREDYGIEGKYLGLWTKRSCSNDSLFDMAKQRCVEKKRFHRQQTLCAQNPSSLSCPIACAVPVYAFDPQTGSPCVWQQSRLYNDPANNNGFLQCVATSVADPCGEWTRVDCPASTSFELKIQICTPNFEQRQDSNRLSACAAANEVAVCRCGAVSSSCPGISVCQDGYCCATVDPTFLTLAGSSLHPQAQSPICFGSGEYPVSSCSIPCPPQFTCQPNVGCCPVAINIQPAVMSTTPSPKMILVQLTACPGSGAPPIASCGSCPMGYTCAPMLGACCPVQPPPATAAPAPQPVFLLCPDTNTPPVSSCPCTLPFACTPVGCCEPAPKIPETPVPEPQYVVLCPGSNMPPQSSCPCKPPFMCTSIGCCTSDASIAPPSSAAKMQLMLCPVTKTKPVASCNACPPNYSCATLMQACCPIPAMTTTPAPSSTPYITGTLYLVCPNGGTPVQQCTTGNSCPLTTVCVQGNCCPCQCPPMSIPVSVCPAQQPSMASAAPICICTNGCCCQQAPLQLPTCSNGQIAAIACTASNQCGVGQECSSGGCCPLPYCPTGSQAVGHCGASTSNICQIGTICVDGMCCALPQCPTGLPASTFCNSNTPCIGGQECINGGCCSVPPSSLPLCPNGVMALVPCAPTCTAATAPECCPANSQCVVGVGCCPYSQPQQMPVCPTSNQLAVAVCSPQTQCPHGTECNTAINACCPLPLCSNGAQALQRCSNGCPAGTNCVNNLCCVPVQTVQVPVPVCVNSLCGPQHSCPPGYACMPDNNCCQLVTDILCPMNNLPICMCSPGGICPPNSACHQGMCCSTPTAYSAVPGTSCEASRQCAGHSSGAQCLQNLCICIKGSYSNGVTCVQQPPLIIQLAQSGCDTYGTPCRYTLSSVRRRPMLSSHKSNNTEPLWFNVVGKRSCPRGVNSTEVDPDNTCLPSEKCIDGVCKLKLWPGEYGCESDLQCKSRCPNTYCEQKSNKDVPQCQCLNGLLLYGRCFETCPKHFHESGGYCQHNDEDAFWSDSAQQTELQKLLDNGTC